MLHQVVYTARDVSARRRSNDALNEAKAEAETANRAKSAFLGAMSHEIHTPMNGVIGMIEFLFDSELSPEQRSHARMAQTSATALLALLGDILGSSRLEAGRLELQDVPLSLRQVVGSAIDSLRVLAERNGLAMRCVVSDDIPGTVVGDPNRIRQIVVNLLSNAIKFTERGEIVVKVAVVERCEGPVKLHITVQNTGSGIPTAFQDRLFAPFTQADGTTVRRHGGVGLGLAISRQLVELMGGSIWAESMSGEGSTFHVMLTLETSAVNHENEVGTFSADVGNVEQRPHAALKLLVVDDNAVNRILIETVLKRRGHDVRGVSCGKDAVAAVPSERFDAVLMDVEMPDIDGIETTEKIREAEAGARRRTPVIALTAHAVKGDRERFLAAGMDGYVAKPVRPQELLECLARVTGG